MYESKTKTLLLAHPSFQIKLGKGIRGIWIVGRKRKNSEGIEDIHDEKKLRL